jgi:hypothetical protein
MGRIKKYQTKEEKSEARRKWSREYYWKNNRLASITIKDGYLQIMPTELKKEVFLEYFFEFLN